MRRRLLVSMVVVLGLSATATVVLLGRPRASLSPDRVELGRGARAVGLELRSANLASCRLQASLPVPGLPRVLRPCPAKASVKVQLPVNDGVRDRRYRLSLVERGTPRADVEVVQRPRYRVLLYGDSIAWQFAPYLERQLRRTGAVELRVGVFPGTSLCDGLAASVRDAASFRPNVVVAQYVGSPFTACSTSPRYGPFGQPAWYAQLTRDAVALARTFRAAGASSVLLDPGPVHEDSSVARDATIAAYDRAVEVEGPYLRRIDPYLAVEAPGDRYVAYLSCLPRERRAGRCEAAGPGGAGQIRVRSPAPDSFHLCPVSFGERRRAGCDTYASGALRYAAAIAGPLIEGWGLHPSPPGWP